MTLKKKQKLNLHLEAIRGVASMSVALYHMISMPHLLNPGYHPQEGILSFLFPSETSVLIFFVLSGYVIGLTNPQKLSDKQSIFTYLKKRWVRLYPIYFVVILLTVLVKPNDMTTIMGNFFFLQVIIFPVVAGNGALWSLTFEVVYYLVFIILSNLNIKKVLLGLVLYILLVSILPITIHPLLIAFPVGLLFWLSGLCIAYYLPKSNSNIPINRVFGLVFLLISIRYFRPLYDYLHTQVITHEIWYYNVCSLSDVALLPFCALSIIVASGHKFRYLRLLETVVFASIVIGIIMSIKQINAVKGLALLFTIVGLFLYYLPQQIKLLNYPFKLLHFTGSISYGIYVIHFPLLWLMPLLPLPTGTIYSLALRLVVFLTLVVLSAFLLEKVYQPYMRKLLYKRSISSKTN